MAAGKMYGIHDVQMRYNKETDEIEILLPGNSSDPTKIIRLPNGGGGSGQGFPVEAVQLRFEDDGTITAIPSPADKGIVFENTQVGPTHIRAEGPYDNNTLSLEGNGNEGEGRVELSANNELILAVSHDGVSPKYGLFDKASAPNVQPDAVVEPVGGVVVDVEARTAISELIAVMKLLGHTTDPV
jgi:hypothetical protein